MKINISIKYKKNRYKKSIFFLSLFSLDIVSNIISYEYPLFYRAPSFWGEPRFEKNLLSTIYFQMRYGSTTKSLGPCGYKTNLLNLYGHYNMLNLGSGVPNLDPSNSLDNILINLNKLPATGDFAQLSFCGKLRLFEANLYLYQNFYKGFFLNLNLPFKLAIINNIKYQDLSPSSEYLNINKFNSTWQSFLTNFNAIMERFDINPTNSENRGFGDLSLIVGWTLNYEDMVKIDFIDTDIQIGVQFPTSKKRCIDNPFVLPIGYPSIGVPIIWDLSIGGYEWATFGARIDGLFFSRYYTQMHIKTDTNQTGLIKLATDTVHFCPGSLWHIGLYFKADHVIRGWSALLGYSYNKQDDDQIRVCSSIFSNEIANTDPALKKWDMHTISMLLEYDFCTHDNIYAPHFAICYDHIFAGQRIMKDSPFSAYLAFDISWKF